MSEPSPYAELELLRFESKKKILALMQELNPSDPDTLSFVTTAMLEVHYTPKELSELLGPSETAIGCWVIKKNIPISAQYCTWCVETIQKHLAEDVERGVAEGLTPVRRQIAHPQPPRGTNL